MCYCQCICRCVTKAAYSDDQFRTFRNCRLAPQKNTSSASQYAAKKYPYYPSSATTASALKQRRLIKYSIQCRKVLMMASAPAIYYQQIYHYINGIKFIISARDFKIFELHNFRLILTLQVLLISRNSKQKCKI